MKSVTPDLIQENTIHLHSLKTHPSSFSLTSPSSRKLNYKKLPIPNNLRTLWMRKERKCKEWSGVSSRLNNNSKNTLSLAYKIPLWNLKIVSSINYVYFRYQKYGTRMTVSLFSTANTSATFSKRRHCLSPPYKAIHHMVDSFEEKFIICSQIDSPPSPRAAHHVRNGETPLSKLSSSLSSLDTYLYQFTPHSQSQVLVAVPRRNWVSPEFPTPLVLQNTASRR